MGLKDDLMGHPRFILKLNELKATVECEGKPEDDLKWMARVALWRELNPGRSGYPIIDDPPSLNPVLRSANSTNTTTPARSPSPLSPTREKVIPPTHVKQLILMKKERDDLIAGNELLKTRVVILEKANEILKTEGEAIKVENEALKTEVKAIQAERDRLKEQWHSLRKTFTQVDEESDSTQPSSQKCSRSSSSVGNISRASMSNLYNIFQASKPLTSFTLNDWRSAIAPCPGTVGAGPSFGVELFTTFVHHPDFQKWSVEELRLADYERGVKGAFFNPPPKQQPQQQVPQTQVSLSKTSSLITIQETDNNNTDLEHLCLHCHELGHDRNECPNKCYICHRRHRARGCWFDTTCHCGYAPSHQRRTCREWCLLCEGGDRLRHLAMQCTRQCAVCGEEPLVGQQGGVSHCGLECARKSCLCGGRHLYQDCDKRVKSASRNGLID